MLQTATLQTTTTHQNEGEPAGATAGSCESRPLRVLETAEDEQIVPHTESEVEDIDVDPLLPRGKELLIRRFCAMAATAGIELDMETVRLYVRRGVKLSQRLVAEMVNRKRRYVAHPEEVLEDHIPQPKPTAAARKLAKRTARIRASMEALLSDLASEEGAIFLVDVTGFQSVADALASMQAGNVAEPDKEEADV